MRESAVEDLIGQDDKSIMVMGGPDTGKTSMVETIADRLARWFNVGIVDMDIGQSHIGPPSTIAWGRIKKRFEGWSGIEPEDFYFAGTTSPIGSLLPFVTGARLITEKALSFCDKVIIDTTGLIAPPVGTILKQFKIDIICPDVIIGLEHSAELGPILDAFRFNRTPSVYRLPVSSAVKAKSVTKRNRYRVEKFKSYFTDSRIVNVSAEGVGIRFVRKPSGLGIADLKNRLVSFRDADNRDIALGIIYGIKSGGKSFLILTPMDQKAKFSSIVIGTTGVDLSVGLGLGSGL